MFPRGVWIARLPLLVPDFPIPLFKMARGEGIYSARNDCELDIQIHPIIFY